MKFHIVKDGEKVKDILFLYNLDIDELKEENKHIRDFKKLLPGTKIKIPVVTKADDEDILEMEPFIEDYYPKKETVIKKEEEIEEIVSEETEEVSIEKEIAEEKKEYRNINHVRIKPNYVNYLLYYNPYYGYFYMPRYYNNKRKR